MSGHHILLPQGVKVQPGDQIWRDRQDGSRWEPADTWMNTFSGYPFRRWVEAPEPGMRAQIAEAWTIINTLHMAQMDQQEAWPRALEWLERNEQYKPTTTTTTNAGE